MTVRRPSNVPVRNVAIATDFSSWSDRATRHALLVARRFGAVIHFLHAVRRSEFALVPDLMVELDVLAQRDCDEMIARLRAVHELDSIEARYWSADGEISEVFGDLIREHCIDLLILGTRGRSGISRFFSGSIAQQISQYVPCPILTVGPQTRGAGREILLNRMLFFTDLSEESRAAIPYVLTAAEAWNAEIDVLTTSSSENSDCLRSIKEFGHAIENLAKPEAHSSIHYHLIPGKPSDAVLDFARQNKEDLIVLGLDRRRSLHGGAHLGDAYEIVSQANCPVLSVRSTPVTTACGCGSNI